MAPADGTYMIPQDTEDPENLAWDTEPTHALYLLPSGQFLFVGYWAGYEASVAAGRWYQQENQVKLTGLGQHLAMDTLPFPTGRRKFARTFELRQGDAGIELWGLDEPGRWSLLSWRGPFRFQGKQVVVELEGSLAEHYGLPSKWEHIARWIEDLSKTTYS